MSTSNSIKRSYSGPVTVNLSAVVSERRVSRRIGSHPGLQMMSDRRIRFLLSTPGLNEYLLTFVDPAWILGAVINSYATSDCLPEEWLRVSFNQHREFQLTKMLNQREFFIDDFFGFLHAVVLGSCTVKRALEIYGIFTTQRPLMSLLEYFTSLLACECADRDMHADLIHTCRYVRVYDSWVANASSSDSAVERLVEDHVLWASPRYPFVWMRDADDMRVLARFDYDDMTDLSTEDDDDM